MRIEITQIVKNVHDVKYLRVDAGVRYWEDASVNGVEDTGGTLIPCRCADRWGPQIDIDGGIVCGWPKGTEASIHYKVCDDGTYTLLAGDGKCIAAYDGYVPDILQPERGGYGDYIIMKIDGSGKIANWNPTFNEWSDDPE